jgi:hypothetical protein
MQNYIKNFITFEEFEANFSLLWWNTMKEFQVMELDLEKLNNFDLSS